MDAHTADRPNYLLGAQLNEGKTKKIYLARGSTEVQPSCTAARFSVIGSSSATQLA